MSHAAEAITGPLVAGLVARPPEDLRHVLHLYRRAECGRLQDVVVDLILAGVALLAIWLVYREGRWDPDDPVLREPAD